MRAVVTAAFVLILQQMLLIGSAMLTVAALAQATGGPFASVLGRGIAHLTVYLPALALYFIVLPRFYGCVLYLLRCKTVLIGSVTDQN
jgi:ABC-2 type transport system permease protein